MLSLGPFTVSELVFFLFPNQAGLEKHKAFGTTPTAQTARVRTHDSKKNKSDGSYTQCVGEQFLSRMNEAKLKSSKAVCQMASSKDHQQRLRISQFMASNLRRSNIPTLLWGLDQSFQQL